MADENPATVTPSDKFWAALTTLYRRFSVIFDAGATAFLTWLLSQDSAAQAAFLGQFGIQASWIPPALFVLRSLFVATPQPKVMADTAVKAEAKAEARAEAKG